MKSLFIIIIALFLSITAKSQNTLKEEYGIEIPAEYSNNPESFALYICATYYTSLSKENSMLDFESKVLVFLNVKDNHPKRREIIGMFLNEYHNLLVCVEDTSHRLRDSETIIKRTIGRGEYGFINHLMFYEDEFFYDLNHYDIVDGKKETILDYIEKILNDPDLFNRYDKASLKVLHNDFIEYDAKRGSEL
jgi:hypothetical protein